MQILSTLLDLLGLTDFFHAMFRVQIGNFTSSFPTWIPFTSFSSLISLVRTSNTMSNRSDESGILGIMHAFTKPDHPKANKVEYSFHRKVVYLLEGEIIAWETV